MEARTKLTPAALAGKGGSENADALTAYLRRNPEALVLSDSGVLRLAHDRMAASLDAYHKGDTANASRLALSAYLDGIEQVEPQPAARDADLLRKIKAELHSLGSQTGTGEDAEEFVREHETQHDLLRLSEDGLHHPEVVGSS